ncbi:MAG: hypothetical protein LAP38_16645 [Acidobacteriia bacterium]|nr:hypothetical protein [Terriglobia bacterium]
MDAEDGRAIFKRIRHHVYDLRRQIDHRRAQDAHFRQNAAVVERRGRNGRPQVHLPQRRSALGQVCVDRVHAVVSGRDIDDVVSALTENTYSADIQRLRVNSTVDRKGAEFSKAVLADQFRLELGFTQVRVGARVVVIRGQHVDLRLRESGYTQRGYRSLHSKSPMDTLSLHS